MNRLFPSILILLIGLSCSTPQKEAVSEKPPIEIEFTFDSSIVDFTLTDSLGLQLSFNKHKDSTIYHYFRFRTAYGLNMSLERQLETLTRMWQTAQDSISIQLESISIGYPLEYPELLERQITIFRDSERWKNHYIENHEPDYDLIKTIMFKEKAYPLDTLLSSFGYKSSGYSIEKVGYVQQEDLRLLGFDENLIVPVPYMVWINVEKNKIR